MQIRPWTPSDDVAAHISGIYEEYGLFFDPSFEDDLFDVPGHYRSGGFWVAENETGLIGTVAIVPQGAARLLRRMYVSKRHRGDGVAAALLRHAAAAGPWKTTWLWSDVRFRAAHRFYQKEGFIGGHCRVLDDPDRSVERFFSRAER